MAMNFKYDGTTWAVTDAQLPDYTDRSREQPGSFRRTFAGVGRNYIRYNKWAQPFSWSMVGTAVRDHVIAISTLTGTGTCTVEYPAGTFICKPVNESYSEKEASYQAYNIGITLKEV